MASLRKRGRYWYVRYRDFDGKSVEEKAGPDKSVANRYRAEVESRLAGVKMGVVDPREAKWAEAERKPILEHVEDWHKFLLSKGSTIIHAKGARRKAARLIECARITRLSGLSLSVAQSALKDLDRFKGRGGNESLSERTVYHHARAIKSFSRWLWTDGRTRENNLVHMTLPAVEEFKVRRALEPGDAASLVECTRSQTTRGLISGLDRSVLYATALGTGYRLNELASLTPENFNLDSVPPTITCKGSDTKNGRAAVQPIHTSLAEFLREWLAEKPPGEPVFVFQATLMARTVRKDLRDAGIASPESYDFHCLRHTYVTMVVKSGASVKVCQDLARHSDPKLTLNVYGHLTLHDVAGGIEGLAHTLPKNAVSRGLLGTGTDTVISSPGRTGLDPASYEKRMEGPYDQAHPRG
jgi:integrase